MGKGKAAKDYARGHRARLRARYRADGEAALEVTAERERHPVIEPPRRRWNSQRPQKV